MKRLPVPTHIGFAKETFDVSFMIYLCTTFLCSCFIYVHTARTSKHVHLIHHMVICIVHQHVTQ